MNELCDVCGLPFREDERRSLYGTRHELTFQCVGRLREENARLRAWLQKIVDGPCAESHHRWAAVEALKGENCDY